MTSPQVSVLLLQHHRVESAILALQSPVTAGPGQKDWLIAFRARGVTQKLESSYTKPGSCVEVVVVMSVRSA